MVTREWNLLYDSQVVGYILKISVLDNIISLSVLLVVKKYGLYSPVVLLRQILVVTLGFQCGKEMS